MGVSPPTNRPISGRCENLRFPETLPGESGNRDFGISSGRHMGGGLLDSGGAFSYVSDAFQRGFPAKTGPGNRPAAPADGGPHLRVAPPTTRPISGRRENLRFPETWSGRSGSRDFGISSGCHWGGLLDPGGAFPYVSVVCCGEGSRRKRGPKIDQLRRPAGVRVQESPRPQIARFRADAKICDFRRRS